MNVNEKESNREVYFNNMMDRLLSDVNKAVTDLQKKAILEATQRAYEYLMETLAEEGMTNKFPENLSEWNRAWSTILFEDSTVRMSRGRASQVDSLFTVYVVIEHSLKPRQQ